MRERSTVMGVRGLADSDNVEFAGNTQPDLRLVTKWKIYQYLNQK